LIESKSWLLLGLFIIILVALFNISSIEENATSPLLGKTQTEAFDYEMSDVKRLHFDESGNLASQLTSTKLVHYPSSKKYQLESPHLYFEMSQRTWLLEATKGVLHEDVNQLNFQEKVLLTNHNKLNSKPVSPQKAITMNMTDLVFNLDKQQAFSPYPIEIKTDFWTLQGVGVSIDIPNQQMTVLDKVYATNEE